VPLVPTFCLEFPDPREDWDWDRAGGLFRPALDLDPRSVAAHQRLCSLVSDLGPNDLALNVQLNSAMGLIYLYEGRYDDAIQQLSRTLELDPAFARPYIFIGDSYIQKKMPEQALQAYEKGAELTHRNLRWLTALLRRWACNIPIHIVKVT
jgi:tetratricopeptide (TPR) repeat protein